MDITIHVQLYEDESADPDGKRWKSIKDPKYSHFSVSDHGDIRNDNTGHVRKLGQNQRGYSQVTLSGPGREHITKKVHTLVWDHFGDRPRTPDDTINHIDHNKSNNHISNLELMTRAENTKDAQRHGLCGSAQPVPIILTLKNGKEIKFESQTEIANLFGVDVATVHYAIKDKRSLKGYVIRAANDTTSTAADIRQSVKHTIPVTVTAPDGTTHTCESITAAGKYIGVSANTVKRYIEKEKSINGYGVQYHQEFTLEIEPE